MSCSETSVAVLRAGVSVYLPALELAWALEGRGFVLEAVGDRLRVQPVTALTPADVQAIREHRDELVRIAAYRAPEVH